MAIKLPILRTSGGQRVWNWGFKDYPRTRFIRLSNWSDHNLPICMLLIKLGRLTDLADDLAGLKIAEGEERAVEKLEKMGALEKTQELTTLFCCERC